jgi:hypothetical protein
VLLQVLADGLLRCGLQHADTPRRWVTSGARQPYHKACWALIHKALAAVLLCAC